MAAAARNYQKELLANEKAPATSSVNQEVDLDELMDDPELEKLHADRIAALKNIGTEGDFLGEVTGTEKAICHFYHQEFYRCKIMDKHLKTLASKHVDTKFIKLDAEVCLFGKGVVVDRLVGFQDMGGKDDFSTRALEVVLIKKGIISEKKGEDDEDDGYHEGSRRMVRPSVNLDDSDSDLKNKKKNKKKRIRK
ncbi:hypothetical protein PRUPE_5G010500 [Prunus persica]|uniref:Thioredoxin domain-containing protein n=1 Tax=Prunus persica TaxID=3760 RepID=A0A251P1T4_PRUPE|nr:hypothetical protein PRUPE_5G010500 [Prunus persica]